MAEKRLHITVSGKVQGVFFRKYTCEKALTLGLRGSVMNRHDGSVFIDVCGADEALQAFCEWCKKGPSRAVVTGIHLVEIFEKSEADSFEISR